MRGVSFLELGLYLDFCYWLLLILLRYFTTWDFETGV